MSESRKLQNTPVALNFHVLKTEVARQFKRMSPHELFRTNVDKNFMWDWYLNSFPEGTNPIYRERTEHDCNCCRSFIRTIGNVVAIIDGKLTSIWDIQVDSPTYQTVANAMAEFVRSQPIENRFLHIEGKVGTDKNFERTPDGEMIPWDHFFVQLPNSRVCKGVEIGPRLSDTRAAHDVFLRGLTELKVDAIDTVLELIGQRSLYRGEEHQFAVESFRDAKTEFDKLPASAHDNFVWSMIDAVPGSVSGFRNTSIGTLLIDLSNGVEMDGAVRKFETMMGGANYKRPTALVTKGMVENARRKVDELGLTSALERRYATVRDMNINDILYADHNTKNVMTGNVFDEIAEGVSVKPRSFDKVEEVTIEKFIADILPSSTSIELLVENRHVNNFVSLIAPADPTAGRLFKWDNGFSWTYNGDFADSIKERVKKAGGNVSGDLCCRLGWFNHDDLDFHLKEPGPRGFEIHFRAKTSPYGGKLDVDMNAGFGRMSREPVENIVYRDAATMLEGVYTLFVHQYNNRESTNVGFEAEIDFKGAVYRFSYEKALKSDERVTVAEFRYTGAKGFEIIKSLPATTVSKKIWNIDTETFRKVNVVMFSPNHWAGRGAGPRHYFFMIDGCLNDGTARGFYNEFLKGEFEPHRKVFEMVGSKMRATESENQLSGLGFSTTQRNHAIVRVKGAFSRTVKVAF